MAHRPRVRDVDGVEICKQNHRLTEDNSYTNPRDGRVSCRECTRRWGREWRRSYPEVAKAWAAANPERMREHGRRGDLKRDNVQRAAERRRARLLNPEEQRRANLWTMHRLRTDEYDAMTAAQNGVCGICFRPPSNGPLQVDHDHSCCPAKKNCDQCNRGLLCGNCNSGLAMFDDSIEWLQNAIDYLRRFLERGPHE